MKLWLPKIFVIRCWQFLVVMVTILFGCFSLSHSKCDFEAIFNFGDSNSDTGGFWAAFPAQSGPFGMTYFNRPAGRASDGRLIIDFLAQGLGLPFLSPYLQSIGSNYRHGANYATLASTVLLPNTSLFVTGISPFSLAIQLNQMKEFKTKVDEFQCSSSSYHGTGIAGVKQYLPQVVSQIAGTIKEVYGLGGRAFLVFNLAPVGCYPALLVERPNNSSDVDEFGCVISYNNAVVDYNNMLKETLTQTGEALSNASLIYVDTHSVLLQLFRHPTSYGLRYGTKACCGHGGGTYNFDPNLYCGNTKVINGSTVTATACSDPENYVSWDGIHTTESANKIIAQAILNGSYFDPPFPLHQLCDIHSIG
ncbi:GDSL esterase/lipase At4g01130 isoform X2 [Quercus lobata]|uniref:GDSL esterase/lipase At4g01130 isoform X2 n=1 Tax=Quercus lobata TaxID=97700 RepID=UPI00124821DA|nr:GDSL esterase/lipase At4g01130 isoform X2 [Quercus lobata]